MSATQHRPVTVSIVSHGQHELLLPLLKQLDLFCQGTVAKIVLTTNIPEPELLSSVEVTLPIVRLVNSKPRGFGANHNAAFSHCDTEWFLVLNPDIRIATDVITALLALAEPTTALLAPRIFEPGRDTPEAHRALLTPIEIWGRHRPNYRPPTRPLWVPGMFMLARASAFREIAGFDERFFMYGEDFDICARLQVAGWQFRVADDLYAQHIARRASRKNWRHMSWHFISLMSVWRSTAFWRYRALVQKSSNAAIDKHPPQ